MSTTSVCMLLACLECVNKAVNVGFHVIAKHSVFSKKKVREKVKGHWRTVSKAVPASQSRFGITGIFCSDDLRCTFRDHDAGPELGIDWFRRGRGEWSSDDL